MQTLVVLPTYEEAQTIDEVLLGIRGALPAAFILVVDDGSPDGTAERAESAAGELGRIDVLRRPAKAVGARTRLAEPKPSSSKATEMAAPIRVAAPTARGARTESKLPGRRHLGRECTRRRRSRSPHPVTSTRASVITWLDILELPSVRSTKVIGTSTTRYPARTTR